MSVPGKLLDFTGRVVIVTGAGSGIGAGIAWRFAEAGAAVALGYLRSERGARELEEEIRAAGGRALPVQGDVTQRRDVQAVVDRVAAEWGRVDVLVNNAGRYPLAPLLEMDDEDWDAVVSANLRSVHLCTQIVANHLRSAGRGGAIVNVASIEASHPAPHHAHYDSAKAGVLMHTRAAALELGPLGIRVNAVSPGLIDHPGLDRDWPEGVEGYRRAVPLGRLGTPRDVADACLFLASPGAGWITGAELVVDGGVTCRPTF